MKKGENIRQRKDGRWEARYTRGYDQDGKRIIASCYAATYEQVVEKRNALLDEICIRDNKPRGIGLLILGAGSHGKEVREIAEATRVFSRITFLDDNASGRDIIGGWSQAEELCGEYTAAIVAVGNRHLRMLWMSRLTEMGYTIPTLIHPSAVISPSARIGVGSVICARATVSTGASVGTGCIISAGAVIDRNATVEDWTHIEK